MSQATAPIEKFGKYQLLRKIGHGGMAEVFLAQADDQPPNAPPVVVKRLHAQLEGDRDAVDLFLTEADVTMMLDHPNVIRVYDSGEVGNRYYMAMEYVHGKDLEQICARFAHKGTVMEPGCAVHLISEVLRGLHYVHRAKTATGRDLTIVHRDITPSNVYVSSAGAVKVGDFGVAKLAGMEKWTMSGSLKGKLAYLSPEQVGGAPPSQSIDLWGAGIMLWELLAGQQAFVGDNDLDIMLRIKAAKVPDLHKANKAVPKQLVKIVEQALHKKERKRFADAGAFLQALEQYTAAAGKPYTAAELVRYLSAALA